MGPTGGAFDERVQLDSVRPAHRKRLQPIVVIVEVHAVLTPAVSQGEQLKAAPAQGVEGVGNLEELRLTCGIDCS